MSAIRALIYLSNYTRPNITFAVKLLARFSASRTRRHWNGIKHIFWYLQGSQDLSLLNTRNQVMKSVGYSNTDYMSDPHNARSYTSYVFLCGGTAILWRCLKQTMVTTSSNHSEIIALY